mmetsp:Transcript_7683/g.18117  ORF Transcript_7683/g.18117 Transcript_7683/m.18117 type:complete len:235 (-) Transcript_7683:584-1288(-)
MTLAAAIHSCTFETKPRTFTCTCSGHLRRERCRLTFSFFPQMTTSCAGAPPRPEPSLLPMALATCSSLPTPSPPPMTRTVRRSGSRPRASRTSARNLGSGLQNARRSGRPCIWMADARTPQRSAKSRTLSEGTKTRSASGWNHMGCAPPRSVTIVTKGIRRRVRRARRRKTLMVMCWVHGCRERMRSGLAPSMAWRKARLHRTFANRWEIQRVMGNLLNRKKTRQNQGLCAIHM